MMAIRIVKERSLTIVVSIIITFAATATTGSPKEHSSYPEHTEGISYVEDFRNSVVDNEYIVKFTGLYKSPARKKYISSCLTRVIEEDQEKHEDNSSPRGSRLKWRILERDNPAAKFPSDFDVLFLQDRDDLHDLIQLAIDSLREHPFIKHVTPQRMITRTLKAVNVSNGETDSNEDASFLEESQDDSIDAEEFSSNNQSKSSRRSSSWSDYSSIFSRRKLLRAIPRQLHSLVSASVLWSQGLSGQGVKVGIFDTGISEAAKKHLKHVILDSNWSNETSSDTLGHGTFVAGIIGSTFSSCIGLAPNASLYMFRVFTNNQVSYTSWFLDAFNYAILVRINVLNLSIGGPDFMDDPFVDKVWELSANNIIIISAIGNDGPLYGSLNNPADQSDVIGVGAVNYQSLVASFSSRGMTTHQLPLGYGRVKPDILAYATNLRSLRNDGLSCRTLSGTSVASPVVTAAVALILSGKKEGSSLANPVNVGTVKHSLIRGAKKLKNTPIFEQGSGKLDLLSFKRQYDNLMDVLPKYGTAEESPLDTLDNHNLPVSFFPSYIEFSEDPYFWPYSTTPLYFSGMPVIANFTIINGLSVTASVTKVVFRCSDDNLKASITHSDILWPYSGWLAVHFWVSHDIPSPKVIKGVISVSIKSLDIETTLQLPLSVKVMPTPPSSKRLLWDQFHNLGYPKGYFPRDNLHMKKDPLDWNGDHIHTNFKDMFNGLRSRGYFVEVLGQPFTCFAAEHYNAILIVDPEEEYFDQEISKLYRDFENNNLSIIVFSDWFNTTVMKKIKFFDDSTRKWWTPDTGGTNIPALNTLLKAFNVSLGDRVIEGDFSIENHEMYFASGTEITGFPKEDSVVVSVDGLIDQSKEVIDDEKVAADDVNILGLYFPKGKGKLAVYGDSNCLDSAHMKKDCFWMLEAILQFTLTGNVPQVFTRHEDERKKKKQTFKLHDIESIKPIDRIVGSNLHKYSKVLDPNSSPPHLSKRPLPSCLQLKETERAEPLNDTFIDELLRHHRDKLWNRMSREERQEESPWILDSRGDILIPTSDYSLQSRDVFNWKTFVVICVISFLLYFLFKRRFRRLTRWYLKSKARKRTRQISQQNDSKAVSDVQTLMESDLLDDERRKLDEEGDDLSNSSESQSILDESDQDPLPLNQ